MTWKPRSKEVEFMTSTTAIRAMTPTLSTRPGAQHGKGPRIDPPRDAQDVANHLRQLTLRAFHAVRSDGDGPNLPDVHRDIVRLEAEIDRLGLGKLLSYTTALRRRVEAAMP
jgi:hypothetical protein